MIVAPKFSFKSDVWNLEAKKKLNFIVVENLYCEVNKFEVIQLEKQISGYKRIIVRIKVYRT